VLFALLYLCLITKKLCHCWPSLCTAPCVWYWHPWQTSRVIFVSWWYRYIYSPDGCAAAALWLLQTSMITSCAGGRHNKPPPPASWPFDLESGVRVTCDNFSLPRPLCCQIRPDLHDIQTDVRRKSSLNAPYPRDGA